MAARLAGISLRNFKAVGDEPLHLRLAPVTLLYGPNGAGKSTILHALHYAREVLHGRLDVDRTERGGALDLGGFRNLLHRRDPDRDMVLGFDLELHDLGDFLAFDGFDLAVDSGRLMYPDHVETARVDMTLRWSRTLARPYASRLTIELMGQAFAVVEATPDLKNVELAWIALDHPVLTDAGHSDDDPDRGIEAVLFAGKQWPPADTLFEDLGPATPRIGVFGWTGALPQLAPRVLHFDLEAHPNDLSDERSDLVTRGYREPAFSRSDTAEPRADLREQEALSDYLDALIIGPVRQLRDALDDLIHIGPLRAVPPRGYRPQVTPDPARWADGMAGWDRLLAMDAEGVARVDAWLSGPDRLRSGFGVKVARSVVIPSAHPLNALIPEATPLDLADLRALWDSLPEKRRVVLVDAMRGIDVEPGDIGVGVSQILPVVVAALDDDARLVAVEQPELHVHPRLQVVLGDLFVEGVQPGWRAAGPSDDADDIGSSGRTFLIETHSEHLLLRLLRRIREAGEGGVGGGADPTTPPVTPATISVNYLLPHPDGVRLLPLRVDETGEFLDGWPDGFFAERRAELF